MPRSLIIYLPCTVGSFQSLFYLISICLIPSISLLLKTLFLAVYFLNGSFLVAYYFSGYHISTFSFKAFLINILFLKISTYILHVSECITSFFFFFSDFTFHQEAEVFGSFLLNLRRVFPPTSCISLVDVLWHFELNMPKTELIISFNFSNYILHFRK